MNELSAQGVDVQAYYYIDSNCVDKMNDYRILRFINGNLPYTFATFDQADILITSAPLPDELNRLAEEKKRMTRPAEKIRCCRRKMRKNSNPTKCVMEVSARNCDDFILCSQINIRITTSINKERHAPWRKTTT